MPQFRLEKEVGPEENSFRLSGKEAFHAIQVLRLRPGDRISCFDPAGRRFDCVIDQINDQGEILGRILSRISKRPARVEISLYQALLKGPAWEEVLGMGTQIGIARFIPIVTSRSAVVIEEKDFEKKNARWNQIVLASVKQSERSSIPPVSSPTLFSKAIKEIPEPELKLFAWENLKEESPALRFMAKYLTPTENQERPAPVHLWIGPEGGFSDPEAASLKEHGAIPFSLGENILRAENAAFASALLIRYEAGELG